MSVTLSDKHLKEFISEDEYTAIAPQIAAAHDLLHNKTGLGNDFTGWVDLPVDGDRYEALLRQKCGGKFIFEE